MKRAIRSLHMSNNFYERSVEYPSYILLYVGYMFSSRRSSTYWKTVLKPLKILQDKLLKPNTNLFRSHRVLPPPDSCFWGNGKPLILITAQDAGEPIHWTTDKVKNVKLLKYGAPALGLPDYAQLFILFMQEGQGIASGKVTNMLNCATLLLFPSPGEGTPHHNCVVTTCEAKKIWEYLTDMTFLNPNLELFVVRSSYYVRSNWVTGYSVTTVNEAAEASPLILKLSVQADELIALAKEVYQLAK